MTGTQHEPKHKKKTPPQMSLGLQGVLGPSGFLGAWMGRGSILVAGWGILSTFFFSSKQTQPIWAETELPGSMSIDMPDSMQTNKTQRWWDADMLEITTLNFNQTLARFHNSQLLIIFFDPTSKSYKELKHLLDATASVLAKRELAGKGIGMMGTCDVTVHTILGHFEARQLTSGWQEQSPTYFRFGRPRFFPVIPLLYKQGGVVAEYVGVIDPTEIIKFLQRHQVPSGGENLKDAASLQTLLNGPSPFAIGCGLSEESSERNAFNQTAHALHGQVIFGHASKSLCNEVLPLSQAKFPCIAWIRHKDASGNKILQVQSLHENHRLGNSSMQIEWITSHRHHLLEHMTPDNSFVFLERQALLVIFLVEQQDTASFSKGEKLFQEIEANLTTDKFQLVWSDCTEFGAQFDAVGKCPVIVTVNTYEMLWKAASLPDLDSKLFRQKNPGNTRALRLQSWLNSMYALWYAHMGETKIGNESTAQAQTGNTSPKNSEEEEEDNHENDMEPELANVEFIKSIPQCTSHPDAVIDSFALYHTMLQRLLVLRAGYNSRYKHLHFDFGSLWKVQKLHPQMKILAEGPKAVERTVQNKTALNVLWRTIEKRARFVYQLSNNSQPVEASLPPALEKGCRALGATFMRLFHHLHGHLTNGTLGVPPQSAREVERRSATTLSVKEFIESYGKKSKPVIITDLQIAEEEPWTLDFFREKCNKTVQLLKKNLTKRSWGGLQKAGKLPIAEFVDSFRENSTRRNWYLHDWSLPSNCPNAFGPAPYKGFTVPKYFAGDYFQRAPFQGYQHSWPSLFIGSNETESAMHIDSGGTNFWLYLLSGRKEWRFFHRDDIINLYMDFTADFFHVDAFNPDDDKFPLFKFAHMYSGVQHPGELMFIPAGNPHSVRNMDHIHGISMNYVDGSNIWAHLWDSLCNSNWGVFEMFTDGKTIPHGMLSNQSCLRFGEWKSTPWRNLSYDIL